MWASLLTSSLCQPPLCPAISHIAEMSRYSRSDARSPKDLLTRDAYIYGRARQKTFTASTSRRASGLIPRGRAYVIPGPRCLKKLWIYSPSSGVCYILAMFVAEAYRAFNLINRARSRCLCRWEWTCGRWGVNRQVANSSLTTSLQLTLVE